MPAFAREGIEIVSHGDRNAGAEAMGARVLRARGAAAADSGGAGSGPSVSAGGQQVAELHRSPGRQGRLRPRERDRHRQGAARAAAPDPHAGQGRGQEDAVRARSPASSAPTWTSCFPGARWGSSRSSASRATPTWRWTRTTCATCAPRCAWGCSNATTARRCGWKFRPAAPTTWPSFLLQQFRLPEQALYRVHGPVNLVRLHAADRPGRRAAPAVPAVQAVVSGAAGAGAVVLRAAEAQATS